MKMKYITKIKLSNGDITNILTSGRHRKGKYLFLDFDFSIFGKVLSCKKIDNESESENFTSPNVTGVSYIEGATLTLDLTDIDKANLTKHETLRFLLTKDIRRGHKQKIIELIKQSHMILETKLYYVDYIISNKEHKFKEFVYDNYKTKIIDENEFYRIFNIETSNEVVTTNKEDSLKGKRQIKKQSQIASKTSSSERELDEGKITSYIDKFYKKYMFDDEMTDAMFSIGEYMWKWNEEDFFDAFMYGLENEHDNYDKEYFDSRLSKTGSTDLLDVLAELLDKGFISKNDFLEWGIDASNAIHEE
jgi:hypothetical protein